MIPTAQQPLRQQSADQLYDAESAAEFMQNSVPIQTSTPFSQQYLDSSSLTPEILRFSDHQLLSNATIPRTLNSVSLTKEQIDSLFRMSVHPQSQVIRTYLTLILVISPATTLFS